MSREAYANTCVQILRAVNDALPQLSPPLRAWLQAHVVVPRALDLCTNRDLGTRTTVWLVTGHTGVDDAPFRIVFDGREFGLEIRLEDGVSYLVHRAAGLADAVECL